MKLSIALAGNPNVGKTTLFNTLTGTRQHVGNWPGKTVERKDGTFIYKKKKYHLIDLPGTYGLSPYSNEELIARDYIINERPDVIVHIVSAENLKRNLFLTTQLMELGRPLILAINMNSLAEKKGISIDETKLEKLLGISVIKIEAINKADAYRLISLAETVSKRKIRSKLSGYGREIEEHITEVEEMLKGISVPKIYTPRWIAIKLLEHDDVVIRITLQLKGGLKIADQSTKVRLHLEDVYGTDVDTIFAQARYGFIDGLMKDTVVIKDSEKKTVTDYLDVVTTSGIFGIPLFFLILWIMFQLTFTAAEPLVLLIESVFSWIQSSTTAYLVSVGASSWMVSFLSDAFIGGVGSVLVFVPNIFVLFFMIALLEDSGYMARVAFVMDRLMHKIGLHGKSFIPLVLGFGCTVPAVMATRTLESKKDRLMTTLISPFFSCSAKLPVYLVFAGAFFEHQQGLVVFSLYLLGVLVAIVVGLGLNKTMFKGLSNPFVMELPPYRVPALKGLLIHMWERGKSFIRKAGTIIFALVVIIWFLGNIPLGVEYASRESLVGGLGAMVAPIFRPLGFGTWQAAVALIFGFVAKEVVIGTYGAVYSVGKEGLTAVLTGVFTPLSAYSFMVFVLLYVPCISTVATIRKELGNKWALFAIAFTTIIAWLVSFIVYQGGLLMGLV